MNQLKQVRRIAVTAMMTLLLGATIASAQLHYVGIPSDRFDYSYSSQNNSQWCWAASIQMVLRHYGVDVSQEHIVARTYGVTRSGDLPNWGGSFQAITANLNGWSVDDDGNRYIVRAQLLAGAPDPTLLVDEVGNQRPLILAYASGPSSGHAVVATAASYMLTRRGPIVRSVIVRDPWPSRSNLSANGRIEYSGASLASHMIGYWVIRVARIG